MWMFWFCRVLILSFFVAILFTGNKMFPPMSIVHLTRAAVVSVCTYSDKILMVTFWGRWFYLGEVGWGNKHIECHYWHIVVIQMTNDQWGGGVIVNIMKWKIWVSASSPGNYYFNINISIYSCIEITLIRQL